MRAPRGRQDAFVFAALVLAGYILVRVLGLDEPWAFLLAAAVALGGWQLVTRGRA